MNLLNIFSDESAMFLAGIIITLVISLFGINKTLLKDFWDFIIEKGYEEFSLPKFLSLLLLTSIGLWVITWVILGIVYQKEFSQEECATLALGVPIIFIFVTTLLYTIFNLIGSNSNTKIYPRSFILLLVFSIIIFVGSIVCVFYLQGLADWGKPKEPFILIWILIGLFILFTWLYFLSHKSLLKSKKPFMAILKKCLTISLIGIGLGTIICDIDILFNSSQPMEIWKLDKKIMSKDPDLINEGLTEGYELLVNQYGFNRFQEILWGGLPDYDPKKYLFVHMQNVLSSQSKKENGLAQGIYGDYYMSYNNGKPSDHILESA